MLVFEESLRYADEIGHLGDNRKGAVGIIFDILFCNGWFNRRCRLVDDVPFFDSHLFNPPLIEVGLDRYLDTDPSHPRNGLAPAAPA